MAFYRITGHIRNVSLETGIRYELLVTDVKPMDEKIGVLSNRIDAYLDTQSQFFGVGDTGGLDESGMMKFEVYSDLEEKTPGELCAQLFCIHDSRHPERLVGCYQNVTLKRIEPLKI